MKKTKNILLLSILLLVLLFSVDTISAKEVVKECSYTYMHTLKSTGSTTTVPAAEGGTIVLKIYDDGSQDGEGKSSGEFLSEGFGGNEELNNWGKSENGASDIKSSSCPSYIGVIVSGLGDRRWYGFTDETINSEGSTVADYDNSDTMHVLKNDSLTSEVTTCEYSFFTMKADYLTKQLYAESKTANLGMFYYPSEELQKYWFESKGDSECISVYSCSEVGGSNVYYYLFSDEGQAALSEHYGNCEWACLNDDKECEKTSCSSYKTLRDDLVLYYSNYKECQDASCKASNLEDANKVIDKISSSCNTILKNSDYNSPCVKKCLSFKEDIDSLKNLYGLSTSGDNGQCGFSKRLLVWLSNILRWAKYIVPVIVIIFGILDFIKAVGADKDDEMKKAQGRFVKRLIAAALIFIVPLILEFVLDKMGFGYDTCGLF